MDFCLIEWPLDKPGLLVSIIELNRIKMVNSKWDRFLEREIIIGQYYFVAENKFCYNVKIIDKGKHKTKLQKNKVCYVMLDFRHISRMFKIISIIQREQATP